MKKSVLLLASMLMGTSAFAQWVKPVPSFVPMVDDGQTELYLYNVEAGAFFLGANDWGTRASISTSAGHPVKMTAIYEDPENPTPETAMGTWAIYDAVKGDRTKWEACSPDNWNGIWVDGGRSGYDKWIIKSIGNNTYEITIPEIFPGKLAAFNKFDGAADTRLYMFDDANEGLYSPGGDQLWEGVNSTWAFISEEEYETILPKMAQYASAVVLGEKITATKEQYEGIKLDAAEAIYNNLNSTVTELDSATNKIIPQAIADFQKGGASADNPADMTGLVPSNDFEDGAAGWTFTTGAQNKGTATNRCNDAEYHGTTMTGHFLENWNPDQFSGKIYTQLTGLPAGVYKLEMDAFANAGSDTYVYMNDFKTNQNGKKSDGSIVPLACGNDIPAKFNLFGDINDGDTLEIGLNVETVSTNWIGIDNVKLTYYGAGIDAYKFWYKTTRDGIIATMDAIVTPETKYDKNQKAIFEAALAVGDAAQTKEALLKAVADLQIAADATLASIEAYKALAAEVEKCKDDETEYGDGPMAIFKDLINAEDKEAGDEALGYLKDEIPAEKMVEISPIQILTECTYSTEYVNQYIADLKQLRDECAAASMLEGTEIALEDAQFTDPNGKGWTKEKGSITWTGGLIPGFPVAESYHSAFDFYQEVTVPDGVYSLALNGFCRLDDDETEVAAQIYMNEYATPFKAITDDQVPTDKAVDGINCYLSNGNESAALTSNPIFAGSKRQSPNDATDSSGDIGYYPNGMEGASVAFSAGRFEAKVYGMVEGGKIRLGARCSSTHQWVLWSNFVLTYEGNNPEALEALAESFVKPAQEYLDNHQDEMSGPAVEALLTAIDAVNDAEEVEDLKKAVKDLNAEVENAKANVEAVAAFAAAKVAMDETAEEYSETASEEATTKYEALSNVEYEALTTAKINDYIAQFNACACMLRIPNYSGASDENAIDMTQVIANPAFEEDVTKWQGDVPAHNSGAQDAEFYNKNYNMYQVLSGLPAGTYELRLQAFYRQGSAENDYKNFTGTPENNAKLFVNADSVAIAQPSSAAIETRDAMDGYAKCGEGESGDLYIPNTMTTGGDMFNNAELDPYWNSIIFKIEEGQEIKIGIAKNVTITGDWTLFNKFELWYYGTDSKKETAINDNAAAQATPVAIYNVAGAKINALQKGINIVEMSDGSVAKILVK